MYSELKYWYLRDHKLFRNLSFSEVDALCILRKFKKSKKNEVIELPKNNQERIYLLKKGALKLIRLNQEGEELVFDIIQKGDLFGELDLNSEIEEKEYIKVISDEAIICTFNRDKLENIMLQKPDFALRYVKFIGFSYKQIKNNYRNLLFKDSRTRFLHLLNTLIEKEQITSETFSLPNYLTQKDIAQLICTTRQTVNSILQQLEKEELISYSQKEIHVLSRTRILNLLENVR